MIINQQQLQQAAQYEYTQADTRIRSHTKTPAHSTALCCVRCTCECYACADVFCVCVFVLPLPLRYVKMLWRLVCVDFCIGICVVHNSYLSADTYVCAFACACCLLAAAVLWVDPQVTSVSQEEATHGRKHEAREKFYSWKDKENNRKVGVCRCVGVWACSCFHCDTCGWHCARVCMCVSGVFVLVAVCVHYIGLSHRCALLEPGTRII